jgi:hypothetical protein
MEYIDWVLLAINLALAPYALHLWKKYSDREFIYFFWIAIGIVCLLLIKLVFLDFLPANLRQIVNLLVLLAWVPLIVAVFLPGMRKNRN